MNLALKFSVSLNVVVLFAAGYLLVQRGSAGEDSGMAGSPPALAIAEAMTSASDPTQHRENLKKQMVSSGAALSERTERDLRLLEFGREIYVLLKEHTMSSESREYWMAPTHGSRREQYHLKKTMRKRTEAFLGFPDHRSLFLATLPPEKSATLARIEQDYQDMQVQLAKERQGVWLPKDRVRDALLAAEKRRDIERLLTPDELFEFRLRTYGPRLHEALADIDLTEEQFRTLYRINAERLGFNPIRTSPGVEELVGVREVLDDEAFNQYRRNVAPGYENLVRLTERLELPREVANEIADMQMSYFEQVQDLGKEGRLEEVSSHQEMGRKRLSDLLGETGTKIYWENFIHQILMGKAYP